MGLGWKVAGDRRLSKLCKLLIQVSDTSTVQDLPLACFPSPAPPSLSLSPLTIYPLSLTFHYLPISLSYLSPSIPLTLCYPPFPFPCLSLLSLSPLSIFYRVFSIYLSSISLPGFSIPYVLNFPS